ncbi:MAG: hypothetical protein JNN04_17180 [Cyclobacteriaceae bacterium]|nr:hypothetical protein [Cyclobacteriaceae bacterium]
MSGEIQAFLNEGINALKEGDTEFAIGQLTEAIKRDQRLWIARYYRAICYKITDRSHLALKDLLEAEAANSSQYELKMELGKVYMILKEGDLSEQCLRGAMKLKPSEVHGYYFLGLLKLLENNVSMAREYFQTCDEMRPEFPDSKIQEGHILMQMGTDEEAAISLFTQAIQLDSMQADARQGRLLIRLQAGRDLSRALDDANFLLTYNQFHLGWRMARANLLIQYKRYDAAFLDIKRVLDVSSMNQDNFIWRTYKREQSIDIQNAGKYLVGRLYGLSDKNQAIIKRHSVKS